MHTSVIDFTRRVTAYDEVAGKRVIEVGAFNVNGSVKGHFLAFGPAVYLGVDMRPGPDVDEVCRAEELVSRYGVQSFDFVVSTEMLEHAEDWRAAVDNMKGLVKVGGILLITARGPLFPLHDNPGDYWRFTTADAKRIFADMEILNVEDDPLASGIFVKARRTSVELAPLADITVAKVDLSIPIPPGWGS